MAGIGWRLERLIGEGVAGAAAAYATGAAVMALPWVLTTIMLLSLPIVIGRGRADLITAGRVVNVAHAVALLVAGPIQIVLSRFAADRVYEGRRNAIAAPIARGLAASMLICAALAVDTLLALGQSPRAAIWGGALSATVGAQWTALSVGNGLCAPSLVLGAVAAGSVVSFLLAAALVVAGGLGVPGYLFGLIVGQVLTLVVVLIGVLRALPPEADEGARLWPAFRDYAPLAVAGLAFNASLWVDKVLAWIVVGGSAAALHASASTLAWFSTIPCLAWVFVEVETTFHRRFRRFYRALESGASLSELRRGVRALEGEAVRLLGGALSLQLGWSAFLELAAHPAFRWLRLGPELELPYRMLLVASGAQAIALLGIILLYYFDLRREACLAATSLFVSISGCTAISIAIGLPPSAGTATGALLGCALAWVLVFRGVSAVLRDTLLAQPYGAARADKHSQRTRRRAVRAQDGVSRPDDRLPGGATTLIEQAERAATRERGRVSGWSAAPRYRR